MQMNKEEKLMMQLYFFLTRYDYLRVAKAIMDDWQNDTCVGKYLKTINERRVNKNKKDIKKLKLIIIPKVMVVSFT
jgi:hypothetical protein